MYIRGLIPRNFAELPEAVPIRSAGGFTKSLIVEIFALKSLLNKDIFTKKQLIFKLLAKIVNF